MEKQLYEMIVEKLEEQYHIIKYYKNNDETGNLILRFADAELGYSVATMLRGLKCNIGISPSHQTVVIFP